ncbi:hypothetical protein AAC387_Pa01g1423 [Persea americana]
MVSASKTESGTQILSARVRKTIQSIKEIVGNHSDADIYVMLKESNMDPNETTQKLLNQDPFREVKRKRDKKKESTGYRGSIETRKPIEQTRQGPKNQSSWDRNNAWRGGSFTRNTSRGAGVSQEFRVVRDNRATQNSSGHSKSASLECTTSANEQAISNVSLKISSKTLTDQKHSDATPRQSMKQLSSQGPNMVHESGPGHARNAHPNGPRRQLSLEEMRPITPNSALQVKVQRPHNSPRNRVAPSNIPAVGLYSSSTDPVHVPPPDSRSSGAVGAIKREVGVVGVRRMPSQDSVTRLSVPSGSFSTLSGKEISASTESFGPSPAISKSDQFSQNSIARPATPNMSGRSFLGNQYNSKPHQQPVGHLKVPQSNMEWKPKSSQKSSLISPSNIGTAATPISPSANNSTISNEVTHLPEKLSHVNISEDQHVIIPQHLRVPEAERSQLTFGSFEQGLGSMKGVMAGFHPVDSVEERKDEPAVSLSLSVPVSSSEDVSGCDEVELLEVQGVSGNDSPASDAASGHPLNGTKESSPQNLDNYRNVGLFQSHGPSYRQEEPQEQQDPSSLATFPGYDSQTYDEPFFRSAMDENVGGQGFSSPQEALSAHATNSAPPSTAAMVQQQPMAQLYPQLHISHYPNFMPYRQLLSPVYVPPMAVPNYSSNPAYPHPPSGSSYLLMQGGSSHLTSGGLKYAASQYKPVPAGGPTGYGNYTNAAGYTMSTPGTVGNATGLEDATRLKYKDSNLYVPNPQADTSELWVQTPRELPSLQSTPYYNLSGQAAPHAAFVPSHAGHNPFNAPTQSTHVPFPGLYHPPQPTAIANPHHLVHQQLPGMGGNVGVGVAAPGPQVGAYQQPQLGHLNWTSNF